MVGGNLRNEKSRLTSSFTDLAGFENLRGLFVAASALFSYFQTMIQIETERLLLQSPHIGLLPMLLAYHQLNREHFSPWSPVVDDADMGSYYTQQLTRYQKHSEEGTALALFLFEKNNREKIIGDVNLSNVVRGVFQSCNMGYRLDEHAQGRGYMRETLQRVVQYAFEEMKLHRIEANIMPHNVRSIKLITAVGFEEEGLAKKYLKINGKWQDHFHYVVLNEKMEE